MNEKNRTHLLRSCAVTALLNELTIEGRRAGTPPQTKRVGAIPIVRLAPSPGGRGHVQSQSPLHILGQLSGIPEPSIGSAGNPSPVVFCVAFGSDPSLPPANTQAHRRHVDRRPGAPLAPYRPSVVRGSRPMKAARRSQSSAPGAGSTSVPKGAPGSTMLRY